MKIIHSKQKTLKSATKDGKRPKKQDEDECEFAGPFYGFNVQKFELIEPMSITEQSTAVDPYSKFDHEGGGGETMRGYRDIKRTAAEKQESFLLLSRTRKIKRNGSTPSGEYESVLFYLAAKMHRAFVQKEFEIAVVSKTDSKIHFCRLLPLFWLQTRN